MKKRILSLLLSLLMIVGLLPVSVLAALTQNDAAYNREILAALEKIVGTEAEAKRYYSILQQYNLLDEDGNAVESWDITMNGETITTEELRTILAGEYDPQQIVWVDGTPITLENLATIFTIEEYIAYLRDTYFYDGGWTEAHEAAYASLCEQINTKGLNLINAVDESKYGDVSGLNHGAIVSFELGEKTDSTVEVIAHLIGGAEGQQASFKYASISASASVTKAEGTVTLTADEDGMAQTSIYVSVPTGAGTLNEASPVCYIHAFDLKNALFADNGRNAFTFELQAEPTVGAGCELGRVIGKIRYSFDLSDGGESGGLRALSGSEVYAIRAGIIDHITVENATPESLAATLQKYGVQAATAEISVGLEPYNTLYERSYRLENVVSPFSYTYTEIAPCENEIDITPDLFRDTDLVFIGGRLRNTVPYNGDFSHQLSVVLCDTNTPSVVSVQAQAGTYSSGAAVPIVVRFSEPVLTGTAEIVANGLRLPAREDSPLYDAASDTLTFLYPVQDVDATTLYVSSVTAEDKNENKLDAYNPAEDAAGIKLDGVALQSCARVRALTGLSCSIEKDTSRSAVLTVTAELNTNPEATTWLLSDLDENNTCRTLTAAVTGFTEKVPLRLENGKLTAQFPLTVTADSQHFKAELYDGDSVLFGKCADAVLDGAVCITKDDLKATVSVRSADGGVYKYAVPENPVIYAQDLPHIQAFFSLGEKEYTFGDKTAVFAKVGSAKVPDGTDFVWESSDISVASIAADGTVLPTGKAGSVYFKLTALNGNLEGKQVTVQTEPIRFGAGLTPFLTIPNKNISAVAGDDISVYWSSNIRDKTDGKAIFRVEVSRGGALVFSASSNGNRVIIPGSRLKYDYTGAAGNTYTVKVSAVFEDKPYTDQATLTVTARPAAVSMVPPETYYLLDTCGTVDVQWHIDSFDRWSSKESELFRLYITKNEKPFYDSADPGTMTGSGAYSGSYTAQIADVVSYGGSVCGYRDVYTVTVQAKNGADSTWSYASYVFYVYDADALQLWIDGKASFGTHKMTNIPAISEMSSEEILELKRDISLKNTICANYDTFAWDEFTDRLEWQSSDSGVASLQYRQGSYFDNIEDYAYTSYRPATEFMLTGLSDGKSTVSVRHALTGMQADVQVEVETLRNKLYLFSCVPAVTTTLSYVNGDGKEKTVQTDKNGDAAIYEESGIAGNVYCTSEYEDNVYTGTFFASEIKSGEGDPGELEVYPCNNLSLRRAAYAYAYLKKTDGTPYTGNVTVRAGVYVNNTYCPDAKFAFASGKSVRQSGAEDNVVSVGPDGKLTLVMDLTQWGLPNGMPAAEDQITYKMLVTSADSHYYPMPVFIDGGMSESDYVRSGSAVQTFRENASGLKSPFILLSEETLYTEFGTQETTDITRYDGKIGVTKNVPEIQLQTAFYWWGIDNVQNPTLSIRTENKVELGTDTAECTDTAFPFLADQPITLHTVRLNGESLRDSVPKGSTKKLTLQYDANRISGSIELPFSIINLDGATPADSKGIGERLNNVIDYADADASMATQIDADDSLISWALQKFADDSYSKKPELINIEFAPTKDPTVFIGFITAGIGTMSNQNATGVYADGTSDTYFYYYPGIREYFSPIRMIKNGGWDYFSPYLDDIFDADVNHYSWGIDYSLKGYLESRLTYDPEEGEWDIEILEGGFSAGFGMNYRRLYNELFYGITVTFEIKVGGSAEVTMDAITAEYINRSKASGKLESDTEFLTNLRIFAYLKGFAGLGWDYAALAFKIGVFGQINFDLNFDWLNRPYIDDHHGEEIELVSQPGGDATSYVLDGQKFNIQGFVGFELYGKFLFATLDKVWCTDPWNMVDEPFSDWKKIDKLWESNEAHYQRYIEDLMQDGSMEVTSLAQDPIYTLNLAPTLDNFDYLENGETQSWNKSTLKKKSFFRRSGAEDGVPAVMQNNAYPFASPALSDDGNLLVYLTDSGSAESPIARAAFAVKSGGGYREMGVIADGGFGDSQNVLSGTEDFAVSAWARTDQSVQKDSGSVLTDEEQMILLHGTEVYASVYQNGAWQTTRLTDNACADMAPVTAVRGSRAVVAWRSVETDNVGGNLTDFNVKDTILYRIYENGAWGETQSLYNGTSGAVKGITAAMLADGTACVAYALDTDGADTTITDREVLYAVVGTDGTVTRTVQATADSNTDENPQLAAVTFGTDERFVLGWYTIESEAEGSVQTEDIRLLDFGADGVETGMLPASVSRITEDPSVLLTSDFRFTKNACNIEELSLIWVEREYTLGEENTELTDKDVLSAARFYTYGADGERIGLTGSLTVAKMDESVLIDSFDAISDKNGDVSAVLLGTSYGKDGETVQRTAETVSGRTVSYTAAKSVSSLYTVGHHYGEAISVWDVSTDPESLQCGAKTAVYFTLSNDGITPLDSVEIRIGKDKTSFDDLHLLPGDRIRLAAEYRVPEKSVQDEEYTITAETENGDAECTGTAHIALPDLQLTSAEIVKAGDGKRTISVLLGNNSDVKLAGSGKTVELRFYTDNNCSREILTMDPITISDTLSMELIDNGAFTLQTEFDVQAYLAAAGDDAAQEIPENGIPVYIRAAIFSDGEEEQEPVQSNNILSVTVESLALKSGSDATISSELQAGDRQTQVDVTLRNNKLSQKTTGNVIVSLLDADGNVIAQKQSYRKGGENDGMVTLGGEETKTLSFTFDCAGVSADVTYSDLVPEDDGNARLAVFTLSNVPGVSVESFAEAEDGTFRAQAEASCAETTAILSPESPEAVITQEGEPVNGYISLPLTQEQNPFAFDVTAKDGTTTRQYILTVIRSDLIRSRAIEALEAQADKDRSDGLNMLLAEGKAAITAAEWENVPTVRDTYLQKLRALQAQVLADTRAEAEKAVRDAADAAVSEAVGAIAETALQKLETASTVQQVQQIRDAALRDIQNAEDANTAVQDAAIEAIRSAADRQRSDAVDTIEQQASQDIRKLGNDAAIRARRDKAIADILYQQKDDGFRLPDSYHKLCYKESVQLKAASTEKIIYTSSDEAVARVDENGLVTACKRGTCIITATLEGTDISRTSEIEVSYTFWDILMWCLHPICSRLHYWCPLLRSFLSVLFHV